MCIRDRNQGIDLVRNSVSFSLAGQFADNMLLTGIDNIDGTGNTLANTLTGNSGNNVLTVVLHPSQHHNVVSTRLDHYSLYGLYEDVLGLPHDEDKQSGSMATAFGLPVAG